MTWSGLDLVSILPFLLIISLRLESKGFAAYNSVAIVKGKEQGKWREEEDIMN